MKEIHRLSRACAARAGFWSLCFTKQLGIPLPATVLLALISPMSTAFVVAQPSEPITFNTNFEGGSLGKIEQVGEAHFICNVRGEQNQRGRNRQANWYYFRMDNVEGCSVTVELTDLVGEYNYRPGAVAVKKDTIPLYSYDNKSWRHFDSMDYDESVPRAILRFRPERNRIWIAHLQPYTTRDLERLFEEVRESPHARIEVIGHSARGRPLHLLTATNFDRPDADKKVVWIMARQHSWETGSSFVAEGAIRFILSNDPEARRLRDRVVFKFTPMVDPDGVARGGVRFNANGYDPNRHWDEVDLRDPRHLRRMPEIWYFKKAIVGFVRRVKPIDLMVYLHNEENGEYISDAPSDDPEFKAKVQRFYDLLVDESIFDATRPPRGADKLSGTSAALYEAARVPALLMEQKITTNTKLGRYPTAADRLRFGGELARCMAGAVASDE